MMRTLAATRIAAAAVMAALLVIAPAMPAAAQTPQPQASQGRRTGAYEVALKCFVTASQVSYWAQKTHDAQAEATYVAKAQRAYEAARVIGRAAGYTPEQIEADASAAIDEETPRLRDAAYLRAAIAQCKAHRFI